MERFTKSGISTGLENARIGHDWWAPVWKGLVLDREGRHYGKIKSALWLFMYLILCADRSTGSLKRKISTISQGMGVKTRTVRTWLKVLRKGGYIDTKNSGRCLVIEIKKWKSYPQSHFSVRQSGKIPSVRVTEKCQSEPVPKSRKTADASQKSALNFKPNDITIKTDKIKNDNVVFDSIPNLETANSRNAINSLAIKICNAFEDEKNLPLYLSYVRKYPIKIIKRAYEEALRMPIHKIKKTRGALFNYLVKHYAEKQNIS